MINQLEVAFEVLYLEDMPQVAETYAQFLSEHPHIRNIPVDDLNWIVLWDENPTLIDMSQPPDERARIRINAISRVGLSCSVGRYSTHTWMHVPVPTLICDSILEDEIDKTDLSMVIDYTYDEEAEC